MSLSFLGFLRLRNLWNLRCQTVQLRSHSLLFSRLAGRCINGTMAVRTLTIVLEDILSTVRTTGDMSCNIYPTGGTCFGAVANLMTTFRTLDNHIPIFIF